MRDKGGKSGAAAGGKARKKKQEKGGSRTFVTSLEEMAHRDEQEEQKQSARKARRDEGDENEGQDGEEDEEDESSDEEEGEEKLVAFERVQTTSLFGFSQKADGPTAEKSKKKKALPFKVENPNLAPKQNKVMKAKDMQGNVEQQLSRRERCVERCVVDLFLFVMKADEWLLSCSEAIEKERAAARYLKKHLAGETVSVEGLSYSTGGIFADKTLSMFVFVFAGGGQEGPGATGGGQAPP